MCKRAAIVLVGMEVAYESRPPCLTPSLHPGLQEVCIECYEQHNPVLLLLMLEGEDNTQLGGSRVTSAGCASC